MAMGIPNFLLREGFGTILIYWLFKINVHAFKITFIISGSKIPLVLTVSKQPCFFVTVQETKHI